MSPIPSCYLNVIPALPLLGSLLNGLIALSWARRKKAGPEIIPSVIGCVLPILSFVLAVWAFFTLKNNPQISGIASEPLFSWISTALVSVKMGFLIDHLSAVMVMVVTGVGSLIHLYSTGYMKGDEGFARYFSYLNLFLFFMLLLVMGDNLLTLFVGWEGVGLCSYLLIGFWFTDPAKASAGKKAFVVNRIGDFGFLIGLFLILKAFQVAGAGGTFFNYAYLAEHKAVLAPLATAITLCLFIGATGKSAQIPLYVWLPDAMAGPTPVSALIHAATMVTAGIYMVARLFFIFEMAPATLHLVATIGLGTALVAALIAVTQYDIKKVLAYSTVSQLGYMFLALGVGAPQAAIFHVVTHAFFKACMFLGAGSVIYALHHEQDIRHMGGLLKKLPLTGMAFLVSTLAIAGVPPFAGFFSKDEILWQTWQHAPHLYYVLALFTAGLTAFYMTRLFVYVFLGEFRGHHEPHHLPIVMNLPVAVLGILAVVGGLVGIPEALGGSNPFHHWLASLTSAAHEAAHSHSLELGLMGLSMAWAALLIVLSFTLYKRNLSWAVGLRSRFSGVYQLVSGKFYIDEIYEALIIRPIHRVSETFLWKGSDQKLVDGFLVHGWSSLAGFGARVVSRLQTGVLGNYLVYLWVGVAFILWLMVKGG